MIPYNRLLQIRLRVDRLTAQSNFEVQMRPGGVTRVAAVGDERSALHPLATADGVAGVMGIACLYTVAVIDNDDITVTALGSAESNDTAGGRPDRRPNWHCDVQAVMCPTPAESVPG